MSRDSAAFSDSLWEEYDRIPIADVVVDIDAPDLQPFYSYRIPESLAGAVAAGVCVHVPFAGREALGYAVEIRHLPAADPLVSRLKPIIAVVDEAIRINAEQMHVVRWMTDRYVCDLSAAVRCVAPSVFGGRVVTRLQLSDPDLDADLAGNSMPQRHLIETLRSLDGEAAMEELRDAANIAGFSSACSALVKKGIIVETRAIARAKTVVKMRTAFRLGPAAGLVTDARPPSAGQTRAIEALTAWERSCADPMPADELLAAAGVTAAVLRGLRRRGLIEAVSAPVRRAATTVDASRTSAPSFTPAQRRAAEGLRARIEAGAFETVLLFGVTASGKTEVYLDAIAYALERGRSAMVLVPEIALTAQVVDVFVGRFGDRVAVLHSRLSEGERLDEWHRMQAGDARIVVGARSAVFAPLSNVGLIVVDEEHEASYKQENTPRYNAKELAMERARVSGAVLVLGSATPSIETFYASSTPSPLERLLARGSPAPVAAMGAVARLELPTRIDDRPLPRVEVVDLREEFKQRRALFSSRLLEGIEQRLRSGRQTILFLNRRGYAQFVLCRDCGFVARCPHCAVSLAFHAYERRLRCHHCDFASFVPQRCPDCGRERIKAFGIGTEKVEEEVLASFPGARVARMDRDTTSRKGAHSSILRSFREGEADILIGTQMVAKGLDFPNVTLVGVVSADTAINMPDFRAAERTFQLLTQVAGRSGRGREPGEVIIQTFSPDHFAVMCAMRQDYPDFYRQEIQFRQELGYPPFSRLANLIFADPVESRSRARAEALAAALAALVPESVEVIGPSPAPIARLKDQFRFHVALRGPTSVNLSEIVRAAVSSLDAANRRGLSIDMDPQSMA
jgi:primosomal protein N' (replication factor Y)